MPIHLIIIQILLYVFIYVTSYIHSMQYNNNSAGHVVLVEYDVISLIEASTLKNMTHRYFALKYVCVLTTFRNVTQHI